jgi:nucleotide-binding universal stress UspA family protein
MTQFAAPPLSAPLLLATDGSPSACLAQKLLYPIGANLEQEAKGKKTLVMLMVKPQLLVRQARKAIAIPEVEARPETELETISDLAEEQNLLNALAADVPKNLAVFLEARRGRPTTEILNYARSLPAGLIAVGHQGLETGMRDFLLGSVSLGVARYATCPVLVARSQIEVETPSWQHVLLVVDGSQATHSAIALTRQLVSAGIQQVTILSVQSPLTTQYLFGPFATPTPSWQLMQSLQQAQKDQSEQIIQQAEAALCLPGLKVQTLTQVSEPGPCICQIAQQQAVNVIILGSDRRPALGNIRLTATGDYVIHHAPCPVLLCRVPRADVLTASPSK